MDPLSDPDESRDLAPSESEWQASGFDPRFLIHSHQTAIPSDRVYPSDLSRTSHWGPNFATWLVNLLFLLFRTAVYTVRQLLLQVQTNGIFHWHPRTCFGNLLPAFPLSWILRPAWRCLWVSSKHLKWLVRTHEQSPEPFIWILPFEKSLCAIDSTTKTMQRSKKHTHNNYLSFEDLNAKSISERKCPNI